MTAKSTTEHLEDLRHQLRLTSEQQAAWHHFVSTVQATIAHVRASEGRPPSPASPKHGLTAYDTRIAVYLEAIRTIRDALSVLTSSLDGAQANRLAMVTASLLWAAGCE